MSNIADQRCHSHLQREAVAKCPECGRFFCRECVTEHDDKVICSSCLKAVSDKGKKASARLTYVATSAGCIASFLLAWFVFFSIGQLLLRIPTSFHEGTLWRDSPNYP